jgi:hypothetical protein
LDVFIVEHERAQGLGKWLISCILECPALDRLPSIGLATGDAHSFYEAFGWERLASGDHLMRLTRTSSPTPDVRRQMPHGDSLQDAASDFCQSQHFLLLDTQLKKNAEGLLSHWAQAVGADPTAFKVKEALLSVAHLDLPLDQRQRFPELLMAFVEHLPSTGRFPSSASWATVIDGSIDGYLAAFRDDGSIRGTTIRKPVAPVGRNEPCPCGSGKKFKKCCGKG